MPRDRVISMLAGFSLFVLFVIWIASAAVASNVAEAKGLDSSSWSLAAFFFGPIGLIGVAGMPDRRLRQYMRSIAIKLEAIEEKESVRLETTSVIATAPTNKQSYIYVDETVKDQQQIIAAVFEQLTEEERTAASAENSDVVPGKMGFICGSGNQLICRLGYVGRKDGKHVWKRS